MVDTITPSSTTKPATPPPTPPPVPPPPFGNPDDALQATKDMVAGYGGEVTTDPDTGITLITLPPGNLDPDKLKELAASASWYLGQTISPDRIAADSFIKHVYTTMPQGTIDQFNAMYRPDVTDEQVAALAAKDYNNWLASINPDSAAGQAIVGAQGQALQDQKWQEYLSQARTTLVNESKRAFISSIMTGISTNMNGGNGTALPTTKILQDLMADAGSRDPAKALQFLESFGNTALEQTLLPSIMRIVLGDMPTLGGKIPDSASLDARQNEIMKWLTEGDNLNTMKDMLKTSWADAGKSINVPKNPLGEPLMSQSDIWAEQRRKFSQTVRSQIPGKMGFGDNLAGSDTWTNEQWAQHTANVNRYQKTFGALDVEKRLPGQLLPASIAAPGSPEAKKQLVSTEGREAQLPSATGEGMESAPADDQQWQRMTQRLGIQPRTVRRVARGVMQ